MATETFKFPDQKGIIDIYGVETNWDFKNDFFEEQNPQPLECPHIEFNSNKIANALTGTGYLSHFFFADELEGYANIVDYIKDLIKGSAKERKERNI